MEPTIIRVQPDDVSERLAALGVNEEALRNAVMRGQLAFGNCTENHPRMFPAIAAWAETVAAVRENLAPLGWTRSELKNYSRAVDCAGRVAIAVAAGNEETGRAEGTPSTKTAKGARTVEAVVINQMQLQLFEDQAPAIGPAEGDDERVTWLLLMYRTQNEMRCELSLPVAIGTDMRVNQWQERIILGRIPLDGEPEEMTPPALPDINVEVRRRP
jgi:hypothetical protein